MRNTKPTTAQRHLLARVQNAGDSGYYATASQRAPGGRFAKLLEAGFLEHRATRPAFAPTLHLTAAGKAALGAKEVV
jgi:hypothetical protein